MKIVKLLNFLGQTIKTGKLYAESKDIVFVVWEGQKAISEISKDLVIIEEKTGERDVLIKSN